jgi:glutathione S-transferase
MSLQSNEHLQRHPWGKVPAVVFPDGFTLYESRAICKYLAQKYAITLLPAATDLEACARFDQAQSTEMLYFADPAGKIGFEKIAKKFLGLPTDEAVVSEAARALEGYFDIAERLLQKSDYMASDSFSLVDIYYVPVMRFLLAFGYKDLVDGHEAVSAWWSRCISRPAIQKMLANDAAARK